MSKKRVGLILATILLVAVMVVASTGASSQGTPHSLLGTWYGVTDIPEVGMTPWTATYAAAGTGYGTCVVEVAGLPVARGVWQRGKGGTFEQTVIALVSEGPWPDTYLVGKESGVIELPDQDTMVFTATSSLYVAAVEDVDTPLMYYIECSGPNTSEGKRLSVEPPCAPPE